MEGKIVYILILYSIVATLKILTLKSK